ncbi:hypothetical protein GDO81_029556, partial [Engystomops pustulosus]
AWSRWRRSTVRTLSSCCSPITGSWCCPPVWGSSPSCCSWMSVTMVWPTWGGRSCPSPCLKTLLAKNNRLDEASLPKDMGALRLEVVNFSGNQFEELPGQLLQMPTLKTLSMGGNRLKSIPSEIENIPDLEFLYLGGNFISYIPPEIANLPHLSYLVLCDNRIQSVPPQLAQLHSLRSLSLHNNLLTYLPREILSLVHLQELSLRGNPLVVRFVRDLTYATPTLLELAGRTIKSRGIPYNPWELPK